MPLARKMNLSNTVDKKGAENVGFSRADIQLAAQARQRTRRQVLVGEAIRVRVKTAAEAITSEASIAHAAVSHGGKLGTNGGASGRHTKHGATSLNTLSVGTAVA